VLGPVAVVEDQELRVAGDHHPAETAAGGVGDRVGARPAGELLPEDRLADLGAERRHRLLLGLQPHAGLELGFELLEDPAHGRRGRLVRLLRFVHGSRAYWVVRLSTTWRLRLPARLVV
jgi:hypothetical protein